MVFSTYQEKWRPDLRDKDVRLWSLGVQTQYFLHIVLNTLSKLSKSICEPFACMRVHTPCKTKSWRTPAETSHDPLLACLQKPLCYAIEQVAGNPPSRAWGFMCTHRGTPPHNQTLPSFRGLETHKQAKTYW